MDHPLLRDIQSVRDRVEHIRSIAGDDEVAHSEEDQLHVEVLSFVATHSKNKMLADMAAEALKTLDIQFARWCA